MLQNYLKIAWRNLVKGKLYSVINIAGLAVGIACCLLIALYVYEELRYDRFHEKADQIYRLNYLLDSEQQNIRLAQTPVPLAEFLSERYPEVEQVVSMKKNPGVVRVDNGLFEEEFLVTGPSFFEIFDFRILQGNTAKSMLSPDEVLLTKSAAERYYGHTNVTGRPIELRIDTTFFQATVAGLVEDPPSYSSIQFRIIVPHNLWTRADPDSDRGNNWGTLSGVRYALLNMQADSEKLSSKITADFKERVNDSFSSNTSIELQPLTGIHLGENVQGGMEPTANAAFIYIAILIAVLILIIACINFTSLSIGHSVRRAREVGMRKAMGARRNQLVAQFWGEALLVVLFALFTGLLLAELLLPYFGSLVDKPLGLRLFENPVILIIIFGVVLLTGLLAGSYPALYLSKFSPSQVFRNKIKVEGRHSLVSILTGVQFTLAVTLITGTFFMHQQMHLMQDSNPGYKKEYVVQIDAPFEEGRRIMEGLKTRLVNEPAVKDISGAWNGLAGTGAEFNNHQISAGGVEIRGFTFGVDPGLPKLLNMNLIEGRFFRVGTDLNSPREVIVNEELVRFFGWEEPLGKDVSRIFTFENATVVGVVEDFHFQSMHHPIAPLVIHPQRFILSIYARIQGNRISEALNRIEDAWKSAAPDVPFGFTFLDDQIEQQYRADQRWADIVELASGIVIVITCMGLFGLATLATAKRSREVAIRKVLGAKVSEVTATLTRDFLKPVFFGLVVALPLVYLLMHQWLTNFAYRIEMEAGTFILAAFLTLGIALLTVCWQAISAALANPAKSLRTE